MTCHRNSAYLAWIRQRSCIGCGDDQSVQAAHVRIGQGGGMGLKPSDYRTVPLCGSCHRIQHQQGERTFWSRLGMDPPAVIAALMLRYLDNIQPAVVELERLIEIERSSKGET